MTTGDVPRPLEALSAREMRFAIVASRFNDFAVSRLLEGALSCLKERGAAADRITVVRVPGSWEIPVFARKLALSNRFDAVVALGVLIRGETLHFDLIAREVARGLAEAAEDSGVPIAFGVLAVENRQQAVDRAGGSAGNRGEESARAAIEAAGAMRELRS